MALKDLRFVEAPVIWSHRVPVAVAWPQPFGLVPSLGFVELHRGTHHARHRRPAGWRSRRYRYQRGEGSRLASGRICANAASLSAGRGAAGSTDGIDHFCAGEEIARSPSSAATSSAVAKAIETRRASLRAIRRARHRNRAWPPGQSLAAYGAPRRHLRMSVAASATAQLFGIYHSPRLSNYVRYGLTATSHGNPTHGKDYPLAPRSASKRAVLDGSDGLHAVLDGDLADLGDRSGEVPGDPAESVALGGHGLGRGTRSDRAGIPAQDHLLSPMQAIHDPPRYLDQGQQVRHIRVRCLRQRQNSWRMAWHAFEASTTRFPVPRPQIKRPWTSRSAHGGSPLGSARGAGHRHAWICERKRRMPGLFVHARQTARVSHGCQCREPDRRAPDRGKIRTG